MKIPGSHIFIASILIKVGGWKQQAHDGRIAVPPTAVGGATSTRNCEGMTAPLPISSDAIVGNKCLNLSAFNLQ